MRVRVSDTRRDNGDTHTHTRARTHTHTHAHTHLAHEAKVGRVRAVHRVLAIVTELHLSWHIVRVRDRGRGGGRVGRREGRCVG